jgi:O-antigen ligase
MPRTGRLVVEPYTIARKQKASPYLTFVCIGVALGVLAMFEPSPGDIGVSMLFVIGCANGNLRFGHRLVLPIMLLGFFVLANLVSLCYAMDFERAGLYLAITLFMLVTWLFILGVLTRYEERGLHAIMFAFAAGGVISSLLAVLSYFHLAPFGEWLLFYDRIKGFFKDPNVFGPYLVIVSVYALHRLQAVGPLRRKLLWLASCLIASVGVLLCYSRSAWMNYAVTLLLFFGLNFMARRGSGSWRKNLAYFSIFILIVAAAISYAMTIPQINDVLSYRTEMQEYDADRFATYAAALRIGLSNPLGVGPAQSFLLLDYATHNLYLRLFSENGVIGFLSFTTFALLTLIRALFLSQKAPSLVQRSLFSLVAAAICGTLLNSFTIDTLHWRHFWLLLALGWMPLWTRSGKPTERLPFRTPARPYLPEMVKDRK